jgi:hypothetical protein
MSKNYDLDVLCGLYHQTIDNWTDTIIAYHITNINNIDAIKDQGLKSNIITKLSYDRQSAVYLFASYQDAIDKQLRLALFGSDNNLAIIKVQISKQFYEYLKYDGIFNMSIICSDNSYPTAIQFLHDIPSNWIKSIIQ